MLLLLSIPLPYAVLSDLVETMENVLRQEDHNTEKHRNGISVIIGTVPLLWRLAFGPVHPTWCTAGTGW
jgi:hypothetical protein